MSNYSFGSMFGGLLFGAPPLFQIFFLLIFGMILFVMIRGLMEWHRNNNSPVLSGECVIVTKRANVSRHHHNTGSGAVHHSTSTTYYVTFQAADGSRRELRVPGCEYGQLAEGDSGLLTWQGTRYHSFQRYSG